MLVRLASSEFDEQMPDRGRVAEQVIQKSADQQAAGVTPVQPMRWRDDVQDEFISALKHRKLNEMG